MTNHFSPPLARAIYAAICAFLAATTSAETPKTMKAVVAHEYGPPDVLKYEDTPIPEPKENEIIVRVIASGVNPADSLIVSGKYAKEFGTHLPLTPGYDIAGVVEKTGAKITKRKIGEHVYAYTLWAAAGRNFA